MTTRLLADNWTFQNAGEFICQGLDGDTVHELVIPDEGELSNENIKAVLAQEKHLQSISRHLDSYSSLTPQGDTTVQIGISWLKVTTKGGSPGNAIKNIFGMRAEVNRLVLNPTGHKSMNKLLRMLGEQHTKRGRHFKDDLARRAAAPK